MATEIRITTYTPTEDVIEHLKDGSGSVVVARAGVAMPWERALMLGLVSGPAPWEPLDAPEPPPVPDLPAVVKVPRGRS
jgi:hypothetical protein